MFRMDCNVSAGAVPDAGVAALNKPEHPLPVAAQAFNVFDLDPAERQRRVLDDLVAANPLPEQANDAALLFLFGQPAVFPCVEEVDQGIEVNLIGVLEASDLTPGEELFAKDALEFGDVVFGQFSAHGVCQVCSDGIVDGHPFGRNDRGWGRLNDGNWRDRRLNQRDRGKRRGWWQDLRFRLGVLRELHLVTEPLGIIPKAGFGAQADELAVVRSPDPFGAVAAAPEFIAVVFTV